MDVRRVEKMHYIIFNVHVRHLVPQRGAGNHSGLELLSGDFIFGVEALHKLRYLPKRTYTGPGDLPDIYGVWPFLV